MSKCSPTPDKVSQRKLLGPVYSVLNLQNNQSKRVGHRLLTLPLIFSSTGLS